MSVGTNNQGEDTMSDEDRDFLILVFNRRSVGSRTSVPLCCQVSVAILKRRLSVQGWLLSTDMSHLKSPATLLALRTNAVSSPP
jgi:hypothetical protein